MPIYYDTTKDSFYIEGHEVGMEKGEIKNAKIAIKKMLKKGFDIKLITEIQGVTQKYIKQIQKEMKNEN